MKQKTFQNNQAQHILLLAQIDGGQTTSSLVFLQRARVVRWGWKQEKVSFRYRWQDDRKGRSCFGYTISQSSVYSGKSSSCEILLFPAACSHPQLIPLGVPLYFSALLFISNHFFINEWMNPKWIHYTSKAEHSLMENQFVKLCFIFHESLKTLIRNRQKCIARSRFSVASSTGNTDWKVGWIMLPHFL